MNSPFERLPWPATIKRELRTIQPTRLPEDWPDDAHFREALGLDSLDLVEMVARLEQMTGLYVPDADLPRLSSVAATAAYLHTRLQAAADVAPDAGSPAGLGAADTAGDARAA